jgi:hypothetical protein
MAIDHRLLHRVQRPGFLAQVLNGKHSLTVQGRHELDACVYGAHPQFTVQQFANDDRAGAAVSFGTTFLGTRQTAIFAQVVEQAAGGVDMLKRLHFTVEHVLDNPLPGGIVISDVLHEGFLEVKRHPLDQAR